MIRRDFICVLLLLLSVGNSAFSQNNSVVIKLDKTSSLELRREIFVPGRHKIAYYKTFVSSIDGVPVFGSDGALPKFQLTKAILKINEKTYELQIDDMYNPWFGNGVDERLFKIIHDSPNDHIMKAQFADGAGSYAAQWRIERDASVREILTKDELIIESQFEK